MALGSLWNSGAALSPQQMQQFTPGMTPQRANELAEARSIRDHTAAWDKTQLPSGIVDQTPQTPWMPARGQQSNADIQGNANLAAATGRARSDLAAEAALAQQRANSLGTQGAVLGQSRPQWGASAPSEHQSWDVYKEQQRQALAAANAGDAKFYQATQAGWYGSKDGRSTVPVDKDAQKAARDKRAATQAERQRNVMLQKQGYNPVDVQMAEAAQQQARELAMQEMANKRAIAGLEGFGRAMGGAYGGNIAPPANLPAQIAPYFGAQPQWGGASAQPQAAIDPVTVTKGQEALATLDPSASIDMQRAVLGGLGIADERIQMEMIREALRRRSPSNFRQSFPSPTPSQQRGINVVASGV
jgi:hypothetical protein